MDTRRNQANPFMGFTSRKGERPSMPGYDAQPQSAPLNMSAFQRPQGVQTPFGSMPNLQAYQNQQDAFVQQFLQNQAQYNQGLMGGQRPEPVDLGATWGQAANNIRDGLYQGNPFATGNVNALMGMFGQYGITPPQGFQDQLIAQLGQQSAPPMYSPQPAFDVPRPINPGTGLSYGQPLTDGPIGPNGEYWPAFRMPQQPTPPAALTPPAPPPPERAPWSPPPPPPGGWRSEQQRRDAEYQSRVQYMMNPGLNQDASPVRQPVVAEPESAAATRPPREVVPNPAGGDRVRDSHVAVFPGGSPINFPPGWQIRNIGDVGGNQSREIYAPGVSDEEVAQFIRDNGGQGGPNGVIRRLGGNLAERGQPSSFAPGYGGSINAPPGAPRWADFRDRDGDMIDDRDQPGPGLPPPGAAQPIPPSQQLPPGRMPDWGFPLDTKPGGPAMDTPPAAQPNPSDPWSYPLLPGMRRGPNGEQIMTEEARQAEIKRREQETGMRYVKPRAPGQTGGWLPAPRPASQAKDQSAAMAEYIRTQATPGRARPTPTRTQGTRRR
jgi:hypothetical protein